MKINYIVAPRQVGKTRAALYEFVKDPGNTYFFTHSVGHNDIIHKQLSKFYFSQHSHNPPKLYSKETYNIFSYNQLHRLHSISTNKAIFDEYNLLSTKKKSEIRNEIIRFKEIYIFTTIGKMYNKEIFDIVKQAKLEGINCCDEITKRVTDKYRISTKVASEEVEDLFYDFVTDPQTNIIYDPFTPFFRQEEIHRRIKLGKYLKNIFSEKEYKLEYENEFLVEGGLEEKKLHLFLFYKYI